MLAAAALARLLAAGHRAERVVAVALRLDLQTKVFVLITTIHRYLAIK